MPRRKDVEWNVSDQPTIDGAQLAVLMDIRDELKKLNEYHASWRVREHQNTLKRIDRRIAKRIKLNGSR